MRARIAFSLVGATLAVVACATPRNHDVDAATASIDVDRVLVAPLNLGLRAPDALHGYDAPIWDALLRHFQALDRSVATISPGDAHVLWSDAIAELEQSGAKPDLQSASSAFASRLARHADYDLLLMPSIVLRSARVVGQQAYWDGTSRHVPGADTIAGPVSELSQFGFGFPTRSLRGRIAAASLHVALLTPDGRTVYQGLGGLDVVQEVNPKGRGTGSSIEVAKRDDPFDRPDHLRQGIALAFERALRSGSRSW